MSQRLLVVDDDRSIREIMKVSLEEEGYLVDTAEDAEQALEAIRRNAPDLLILDVMLPGMDGFELTREIRRNSSLPIILLTAKTDTIDKVVGLESGADDYVMKPYEPRELLARLRALLRRVSSDDSDVLRVYRVGPIEIRPDEGVVRKHDQPLSLTKTEFRLLATLAEKPGRVFSREQLLTEVWGYDYFGDARLVDVHIKRLREKIEDDKHDPKIIQTVRGMGYKVSEE
jgi:two-component system, OmpR family, response regulator MtrA